MHRVVGTVAAFMLSFAMPGALAAQLSLSSAVELALKNDPRIKIAQADVKKAQAALNQTYDAYIPKVGLDAGYGKGIGVPTGLPTVATLSSQSLLFNFSERDNIRSASAGVESAKLSAQEAVDTVTEDAVTTYINLSSDQQRRDTMRDEYAASQQLVSIVQQRLDAGLDTSTMLLQARRTATQIKLDQLHLENDIAVLSHHLSLLMGIPDRLFEALPQSIPALPAVASIDDNVVQPNSYGIRAAVANANSKQEMAFGLDRYVLRPQIGLGLNYSRIDTAQNDYTQYYPNFVGKSQNAESVYISVTIPIFDRRHQDEAKQAAAEAIRSRREADQQRNQFLDSRFRLRRTATELSLRVDLAGIDRDLAHEQLSAVTAQQSADASGLDRQQNTPKDEQNARIEERARTLQLLSTQFELDQAKVSLLRQAGELDTWLKAALKLPAADLTAPTKR